MDTGGEEVCFYIGNEKFKRTFLFGAVTYVSAEASAGASWIYNFYAVQNK